MKELFHDDERYVGRDYGSHEYPITPEVVMKYIEGTGDNHPWYRGNSPLGGPLAPVMLLHSAVFKTLDWYLPNLYGNLHTREEWEQFAPVMVGDTLNARTVIADRYVKRDREYVVAEVIATNAAGRIVAISRTHQSFLPSERKNEGFVVDQGREKDQARSFRIGDRGGEPFDAPSRKITTTMCTAFSGPGLNYHNDRAEAVKLGFPEIVVQGMLSVCLISEMMTRRFGLGWFHGGKLDVRLVNVVWGNDQTGPKGLLLERHAEGKRSRAAADVWCEKADGIKTVVGTATALEL